MAKNKKNTQAIENTEAIVEVEAIVEAPAEVTEPAGPKQMILFTASRGKNTRLSWAEVIVEPDAPTTKVKGVAAELPIEAAEIIGTDKFVAWIDLATIKKCVEENKAVRGTASTVSDVYNRYTKVTDTKGERVEVAINVFKQIVEAIENANIRGEWVRPEPEKAPEEASAEAEPENIEAPEVA